MAGMMAMSVAPVRRASAHCEGTVKERSYLPCSGPWVKPRTSGAVLRYCTTEMRSLLTGLWDARFGRRPLQKRSIAEAKSVRSARLWCKRFVRNGGFEDDETDALRGDFGGDDDGGGGVERAKCASAGW